MGNGFIDWFARSAKYIVIVLLAIAAVTLVVLAQQNVRANASAGQTAGPIPTFTSVPAEIRRLAVIGDSYTAGTDNPKIWPSIVAQREHFRLFDAGVPGAAYSGTGPTFQQQVDSVVEFKPSVVLVLGGRNDSERADEVPAAATTFYSTLKQKLPDTKIVIMGPIWDDSTPSSGVQAVNDATRAAAKSTGLTYHDVLNERWLKDPSMIGPDGIHPNDAGHAQLADKIASIVESDGLGPKS